MSAILRWIRTKTDLPALDGSSDSTFYSSPFVSDAVLLAYRSFVFFLLLGSELWQWFTYDNFGNHFRYFTNLSLDSYVLLTGMLCYASLWGVYSARKASLLRPSPREFSVDFRRFVSILAQISLSFGIMTIVVYWTLLYNPNDEYEDWTYNNLIRHLFNLVLFFGETLLNSLPHNPFHIWMAWGALLAYMFFTWIYYAFTGHWVYWFLNLNRDTRFIIYPGLFVGYSIFFWGLAQGTYYLRDTLQRKFAPNRNVEPPHEPL